MYLSTLLKFVECVILISAISAILDRVYSETEVIYIERSTVLLTITTGTKYAIIIISTTCSIRASNTDCVFCSCDITQTLFYSEFTATSEYDNEHDPDCFGDMPAGRDVNRRQNPHEKGKYYLFLRNMLRAKLRKYRGVFKAKSRNWSQQLEHKQVPKKGDGNSCPKG